MDQRYMDLYAAVVRQAFHDVRHGVHGKGMDAAAWLELAGLVDPDGTPCYGTPDEHTRRRWARAHMKEQTT